MISLRLRAALVSVTLLAAACGGPQWADPNGNGGASATLGKGGDTGGPSSGVAGEAGETSGGSNGPECAGGAVNPVWPKGAVLTASAGAGIVALSWPKASGADRYEIFVDDSAAATTSATSFDLALAPGKSRTIRIEAAELCGGRAKGPQASSVTGLLPDPADIATVIPGTRITPFSSAVSFLYTGKNPIQLGVKDGAIQADHVSVLRGKVTECDGTPLAGVKVTVPKAPELGWTFTRADGQYDLAVNGCCQVGVQFDAAGYPSAQRQVTTPWHQYVNVPSVSLVPYDTKVTEVVLPSVGAVSAQGSVTKDSAGTRHATVIFPPGVTASMTLPDGTESPLPTLHVRATEYTSDTCGKAGMPAYLPAESAFTYAAELSADEAVQAGATAVNFSKPVALYVDNFIGFPIGAAAPTGYYNRETQCWQPVPNGVVLTVVSIADGKAALDVNGDGVADSAAVLSKLGVTTEETQELAKIYAAGTSLWRSSLPHFSPWDVNWASHPNAIGGPADYVPQITITIPQDFCENGSRIGCVSRSLGESIPIVGTTTALSFVSKSIVPVNLDIPATPTNGVARLDRSLVAVDVAGRHFEQAFEAIPSQVYHFSWDGIDAYGREVIGATPINVLVTYFFKAVYLPSGYAFAAFGDFGTTTIEGSTQWTVNARGDIDISNAWSGTVTARSPSAAEIGGGWRTSDLKVFDATNNSILLGDGETREIQQAAHAGNGLMIETVAGSGAAAFDGDGGPAALAKFNYPTSLAMGPDGSLYVADTDNHRIRKITPDGIVNTVAGTGRPAVQPDQGLFTELDESDALETDLFRPQGLALDCEGDLYIGDQAGSLYRKLTPDGKLHALPFRQLGYFEGLDGPAESASWTSGSPTEMATGSNCRVYFSSDQGAISRLDADGYLRLLAGSTENTTLGGFVDGGPARGARYQLLSFAYEPAGGSLLFAGDIIGDPQRSRSLIRVTPDGLQHIVAGAPGGIIAGPTGDGGAALAAGIFRPRAVTPSRLGDGAFVFIDPSPTSQLGVTSPSFIRLVDRSGTINSIAGTGNKRGERIRAIDAGIDSAQGLAVAPDNTIYVAASLENRIRRIGPLSGVGAKLEPSASSGISSTSAAIPRALSQAADQLTLNEMAVPDSSGSVVDVFDRISGQHLRSFDALTGTLLQRYSYDDAGKVTSVTDTFDNVTTYAYDDAGKLTSVTSPYKQVTTLHYDPDNNLDLVTNPAGDQYRMSYKAGTQLLASFQNPAGNASTFDYDSLGRLSKDSDAVGGSKTVTPVDAAPGHTATTVTTALGRTNSYGATVDNDGATTGRAVQRFYGSSSASATGADGKRTVTYEGGSTLTTGSDEDPRFGSLVPVANSVLVKNGNQSSTINTVRSVTLSDQLNPFSLTNFSETTTVDGNTSSRTFDRLGKTVTQKSAVGRTQVAKLNDLGQVSEVDKPGMAPTIIAYDDRGRATSYSQGQRTSTLSYDENGYVKSATDPLGRTQHFSRDAVGRLLGATFGDDANSPQIKSKYDTDSNLTSLTTPAGNGHDLAYTPVDLLQSYSPPLVSGATARTPTTYTRNLDRQITDITRADGSKIHFDYDAATARATAVTLPGTDGKITLTYDDAVTRDILSSAGPAGTSVKLSYTDGLVSALAWTGTVQGTVRKTYDGKFRLSSESVDGSFNTSLFGYDADGLLTSAGGLTITREVATGRVSGTSFGIVTDARSYDATYGEPLEYSATVTSTALFDNVFERDNLGRITLKTETINGTTTKYGYAYDDQGRLTTVSSNGSVTSSYSYDLNGNRTERQAGGTTEAGTYDEQDRLTSYDNASYAYNPAGDLLSKTIGGAATLYHYDAIGNLRSVVLPSGSTITYEVDAAGRRLGKSIDGVLNKGYLYRNASQLKAVVDGTGAVLQSFVYGPSPVPVLMSTGTNTYRIISDHIGSVRLVVDATTGIVAQRLSYDEFGRITEDTNPGFQPFGFAGGLYDPTTGLTHFGARDYDPQVGRWTTKDPLLLGGGSNLYIYVGNDPINLTDISGLLAGVPDWLLWLDDHGVLQTAGDFSAGLAAGLTFGLSDKLIALTGLGKYENRCSGAYFGGNLASMAVGFFGGSLAGAAESVVAEGAAIPELAPHVARTFENSEYVGSVLTEDTVAFRAEGEQLGRWYGTAQPESAAHAEQLYNVADYGNDLTSVSKYVIPEGTTVYTGPVAGGTGTQIFVSDPLGSGVQLLETSPLAQYGF